MENYIDKEVSDAPTKEMTEKIVGRIRTRMKPTDLMIGDWVYNSYHKINIQWNYGEMFCPNGYPVIGKDLHPIPLTAEILEKNGFTKVDFSHYQINDRTLVLDADGKWDGELSWHWVVTEMSTNSKGQNVVLDYYVATINYCHELQHALRLCGLDDLADNFQIK